MSDFERSADVKELLGKRISQLGLRLEGSPVERFVHQLHRELERKGLRRFKPVCYLTDEWGCPDGQPVIGIPFYLADPQLARLERAMNDPELHAVKQQEFGNMTTFLEWTRTSEYRRWSWPERHGEPQLAPPLQRAYRAAQGAVTSARRR